MLPKDIGLYSNALNTENINFNEQGLMNTLSDVDKKASHTLDTKSAPQ